MRSDDFCEPSFTSIFFDYRNGLISFFQFARTAFSKIETKMMRYPHLTKSTTAGTNVKTV